MYYALLSSRWLLRGAIFPVGLGHSKVVEHGFRPQKARRQRDGSNAALAQLASHGEGQPDDGNLD